MRHPLSKRTCKHCQTFFDPDPRSAGRQRYCSKPACRHASKATSQRRWLQKPANRDDFTGPTQVERVRQWRKAHPGYWRRPTDALQDAFFTQPAVVVGLIAHLTGLTLQDDIATTARRLQQLGRAILSRSPLHHGGIPDAQTPYFVGQTPTHPPAVQRGRSAPGP